MIIFNKHLCLSHRVVAIADLSSGRLYEISSNVTSQHLSFKEPKWTGLGVFLLNTICKNGFPSNFFTMAAHWLLNCSHTLWLRDGLNKEHCVMFSSRISSRNKSDWMCKRQYKQKYKVVVNKSETLKHMQILGVRPQHEAKLKWRLRHNVLGINMPFAAWMTLRQQGGVLRWARSAPSHGQSWERPAVKETRPASGHEVLAATAITAQCCLLVPCCHQPTQAGNLWGN